MRQWYQYIHVGQWHLMMRQWYQYIHVGQWHLMMRQWYQYVHVIALEAGKISQGKFESNTPDLVTHLQKCTSVIISKELTDEAMASIRTCVS